ncbi:hydrolase [Clostridium fallax]|uniref:Hydrolase n=1 Tax=Clostridium fallax TaxID=1533 RepID=A0A1M4XPW3_9CLOT|nr:hydrolase [Clostridium fallax]SHE95461.1 hypothetical protein SAMN05443638_1202 [Clostridium fallax]SQB08092.1 enzyme with TIM-barrel fold [Clostridium fallax]
MENSKIIIKDGKKVPAITSSLRNHMIRLPLVIREATGIIINGKRIKSLLFSTDVAIIKNTNADAIIAVYPFTPQPIITESIIMAADVPVFCGVGGGITQGRRVLNLALDGEFKGAAGVVVNAPTSNEIIKKLYESIDIPVIVTIASEKDDFAERINSGATILNVSGGKSTPSIVSRIREEFPDFPIIATGGPTEETIKETILSGANAITYTPPTAGEIFSKIMLKYRGE